MKVIAANDAGSRLAANLAAGGTSLTLEAGGGAAFPSPASGFYASITIVDSGTGLIKEIIWYTTKTGDVLSGLTRGREGTTARDWAVFDFVDNLWTAGQMMKMAQDPSDQLGGVSAVQVYAGNPNGNVAGNAAVVGTSAPSLTWDSTNKIFWACTTTGTTSTAVWTALSSPGASNFAGVATGTANALTLTPSIPVSLSSGTAVSFVIASANTASATANVSGTGAVTILKNGRNGLTPLVGGELQAGNTAQIRYNGTNWVLEIKRLGTASDANASSSTGVLAAVSGAVVPGHIPVFSDTAGTVVDGGPANVGGAPFPLTPANNGQTFGPGVYFIDTTTGAVNINMSGSISAGAGWTFIDQRGTWATNNFTVNTPAGINLVSNGITTQGVVANLSGWEFTIEYDGTNMGGL